MNPLALQYSPEQIAILRQSVREHTLRQSPYVRQPNFIKLSDADVLLLFRLYDQLFFNSELHALVVEKTDTPLRLLVSTAMTSAGGKTTRYRRRSMIGTVTTSYQIAIAGRLLFNSFTSRTSIGRPVHVSGHACSDRLDAMMRIMEHELIHLLELLTFGSSSCSKTRFMTLAQRLFGHAHATHGLVTTREHAATVHQLHTGQQVQFSHHGKLYHGFINRIAVRATVLVADARGQRYTNGQSYLKFYLPLSRLKALPQPAIAQPAGRLANRSDLIGADLPGRSVASSRT